MDSRAEMNSLLSNHEILHIAKASFSGVSTVKNVAEWNIEEPIETIVGFLGAHFKLRLVIHLEGSNIPFVKHYFVKSLPLKDLHERQFLKDWGIFEKESAIYKSIFEHMPDKHLGLKWRPKCYLTRDDLIVLEDLSNEKYTVLPWGYEITQTHIQCVLKSLAIMHANSINYEVNIIKSSIGERHDKILFEIFVSPRNKWFMTGLNAVKEIALKKSKYRKDPVLLRKIQDELMDHLHKVFTLLDHIPSEFLSVLCHRDIWNNNIMFQFDSRNGQLDYSTPLQCVLVDFQTMRYQPPAADIMSYICRLHSRAVWKENLLKNLEVYYKFLKNALEMFRLKVESFVTFDVLMESCEYFELLGLVMNVTSHQVTHLPDGTLNELQRNKEEYEDFIIGEGRANKLMSYMKLNEKFNKSMMDAVDEIIEYLFVETPTKPEQ